MPEYVEILNAAFPGVLEAFDLAYRAAPAQVKAMWLYAEGFEEPT